MNISNLEEMKALALMFRGRIRRSEAKGWGPHPSLPLSQSKNPTVSPTSNIFLRRSPQLLPLLFSSHAILRPPLTMICQGVQEPRPGRETVNSVGQLLGMLAMHVVRGSRDANSAPSYRNPLKSPMAEPLMHVNGVRV